jgi:pSer/pThr/pTyr-binding forkhead associated (FHA) protein
MKLSLVVRNVGTMQGKTIPVTLSQFLIGRDPQCQLRPASPLISNRHCALLVKGNKAFVRDFESTNGTFVNDQAVKGQRELHDGDQLRLGPIALEVRVAATAPVEKRAPAVKPPSEPVDDDAMAALLLAVPEDGDAAPMGVSLDPEGIPTGETVMDVKVPQAADETQLPENRSPREKKAKPSSVKGEDTAAVANSLLQKYLRRGRK